MTKFTIVKKTDQEEPLHYEVADKLYKPHGTFFSKQQIAEVIKEVQTRRSIPKIELLEQEKPEGYQFKITKLRQSIGITYGAFHSMLNKIRERLETTKDCTLIYSRFTDQYMIAHKGTKEITEFGVKAHVYAFFWGCRANRIAPLMAHEYVQEALEKHVSRVQKKIQGFEDMKNPFLKELVRLRRERKKQFLLEHKGGHTNGKTRYTVRRKETQKKGVSKKMVPLPFKKGFTHKKKVSV